MCANASIEMVIRFVYVESQRFFCVALLIFPIATHFVVVVSAQNYRRCSCSLDCRHDCLAFLHFEAKIPKSIGSCRMFSFCYRTLQGALHSQWFIVACFCAYRYRIGGFRVAFAWRCSSAYAHHMQKERQIIYLTFTNEQPNTRFLNSERRKWQSVGAQHAKVINP